MKPISIRLHFAAAVLAAVAASATEAAIAQEVVPGVPAGGPASVPAAPPQSRPVPAPIEIRPEEAGPTAPAPGDDRMAPLTDYQKALAIQMGGDREIPLEWKAQHFEWLLWRYFLSEWGFAYTYVHLPAEAGARWKPVGEPDNSTWNGSLLAAMSFKYGATRDAQTLERIKQLLEGLHFFQEVSGRPGLPVRGVFDEFIHPDFTTSKYVLPGGRELHYRSDAAKGTINQIAFGYAALRFTGAWDALPLKHQEMAREDAALVAWHLVEHDYHLTEKDGKRTKYGDVTPIVATLGVPFNAQVAYAVVAAGRSYQSLDAGRRQKIQEGWDRLRQKHHAYYEDPLRHLIRPQEIGASSFVKGMNDRMHVSTAAFTGLMLEYDDARRDNRAVEPKFLYQLGQTLDWSISYLAPRRNGLVNFMWCGVLTRPGAFQAIVRRDPAPVERQFGGLLNVGVEQLRRYPLVRCRTGGEGVELKKDQVQWVDAHGPDSYYWKCKDTIQWKSNGELQPFMFAPVDYLVAYWMLRYFDLDRHPQAAEAHRRVLIRIGPPPAPVQFPPMEVGALVDDPRATPSASAIPSIQARPGAPLASEGPSLAVPSPPSPTPDLADAPNASGDES